MIIDDAHGARIKGKPSRVQAKRRKDREGAACCRIGRSGRGEKIKNKKNIKKNPEGKGEKKSLSKRGEKEKRGTGGDWGGPWEGGGKIWKLFVVRQRPAHG